MRKIIKLIIYFLIFIVLFTTSVNAEEEACKITLSSDKTTLSAGEEVTLTLFMSNVSKESGIANFISVLNLSDDIFEIVLIEDEELSEALEGSEFEGCDILYSGYNDTDTTIKNPWYLLYLETEGSKGLYASTAADAQMEDQIVGKIKLKVKENVQATQTTISIVGTEVFDLEAILNSETTGDLVGYEIADSEIQLEIKGTSKDGASSVNNATQNNTNKSNNTKNNINKTINNQNQVENKSKQDVPYTGIEDYIPFLFIIIIISVITYINYRKYKDI